MPSASDAVWLSVLPDMSSFGPALAKGAGSEADKQGKAVGGRYGKAMLAGVAVVAGGAALATKALYNIGATFDDVTDTIRVGTGATGDALKALTDSAKNVGKRVPADFKDVGTAIADVNTRLGHTGKPLEAMTEQFLELSRITGTDVATNIENVSRVFGDWGIEQDKQAEKMDYLFKVSQSTGIGIDDLSNKVVQYGAPMRQFGFSFEDSAALMGKWAKEGVNTETVMGGLRAGLGKLSKAGKDPAKAFKTITEQIKNAGTVGEANTIAIETFGQRAGPDLAAAVREGRLDLEDLTKSLDASGETIMGAGADTMDFSEQWKLFKNEVMVGLEPLATKVFGAITVGMEWIRTKGVPAIKDFVGWMKENKTILLIVAGAVGTVVAALLIYNTTTKVITASTKAWAAVQKILNTQLKLNPIGVVVTALALLAGALVIAYKKSETFRKIVDAAWTGIKNAALFAWEKVIQPIFKAWWAYLTNVLIPIVKFLWEKVVKPVFGWIGDKIKTVWNNVIKPVFNALKDFIKDKVAPGFQRGVEMIGNAWDGLKSAAAKPINFVIGTVYNDGIRKVFNSVAEKLGSKMRLPAASLVGTGGGGGGGTHRPLPGVPAIGGAGRLPEAMGGPLDWAKKVAGKGAKWVGGKFTGMVDKLLTGAGSSPWASLATSAARKVAGLAGDWLMGKADEKKAAGMGKVGAAGRVLPAGSYRVGMPYLGYPGHYGADYPAPAGTPVFSPWPGRVTATYDLPGSNPYNSTPYRSYGRVVKITHDNGLSTLYAHLTDRIGSTGPIAAGQQIGTVGTTGNSTGNHLHFEARRGGSPFNPAGLGIFDKGGWLKPGMGGINLSSKPEPVFSSAQWGILSGALGGKGDKDKSGTGWVLGQKSLEKQERQAEKMLAAVVALKEAADQQKEAARAQYDAVKSSIVGALSPDLYGGGTLASFDRSLRGKLANNLGFEKVLADLIAAGLDGALFDEVAATGDLRFASQLLGAGAGGIAEYERMFAEANASANRSGDLVAAQNGRADQLAHAERNAAEMLTVQKRQEAELKGIKKAVQEQAAELAAALDGAAAKGQRNRQNRPGR